MLLLRLRLLVLLVEYLKLAKLVATVLIKATNADIYDAKNEVVEDCNGTVTFYHKVLKYCIINITLLLDVFTNDISSYLHKKFFDEKISRLYLA
jgi:hypothetical protein